MTTTETRPATGLVLRDIAVRDVTEHPGNPRQHFDDIEELAASLLEVGLIEPIVVERLPAGFRLIAGARRLRAARLARIRTLPAIVRPPIGDPAEALLLMLVENGQRSTLDPIEEARGYARLRGLGLTGDEIARRIGKSAASVSQRLMLLNLTAGEQEAVRRGDLLVRDAREIARERARHPRADPVHRLAPRSHPPPGRQGPRPLRPHQHPPRRRHRLRRLLGADHPRGRADPARGRRPADRSDTPPAHKSPKPGSVQREQGVDDAAVDRAIAGERMALTIPEREEAVRRLCGRGLSDGQIGDRLHFTGRTVGRIRDRLGIPANVDDAGEPTWRAS